VIIQNASDELKITLGEMEEDPRQAVDLYRYLLMESKGEKELEEEVTDHFRHYVEYIDLYEFLDYLIRNSDGKLREILEDLNLRELRITTIPGLIEYLLGLDTLEEEIVYNAVSDAMTHFYVEKMLEELAGLSSEYEGLQKALQDVNLEQTPLYNLQDVIDYLSPQKESYGFTSNEFNEVIEKYLSGELPFEVKTIDEEKMKSEDGDRAGRGARLTLLILLAEGLIILILILLERRKKKRKEHPEK
jgi:hypothetical protein